ncbi:unnamed protein product, partial [Rotaria sordida]
MAVLPFLTYKILPSQTIIRENIRLGHVKEDIDALIHALTPILFITKSGVPRPPFLDPGVVQHLIDKPATLNLLQLFGWVPNNRGDYVFVNANSPEETNQREKIANEFRQFYDELKKIKGQDISSIITTRPFSSYHIIPAEKIIRDNIRVGSIKEDLDSMFRALTPIVYLTKPGVPKPPFLDPSIIQQLADKPGTLNLLPLFGCTLNNRGDYIFVDANRSEDSALREAAGNEFRQFYDELKKIKNGSSIVMEYFLNHPNNNFSQVDTCLGAQQMVDILTTKNLSLEDQARELQDTVDNLFHEVFNIFSNLNSRFAAIVNNMPLIPVYLGLNAMSITVTEFYYTHLSQSNICHRLISLCISNEFAFDNGLWLASHVSTFNNLRHLSLIDIKRSSFELIINAFSPNTPLIMFAIRFSTYSRAAYTFVGMPEGAYYEQIFHLFPFLRVCDLRFWRCIYDTLDNQIVLPFDEVFMPIETSLFNLQSIVIRECSPAFLLHLLEHLPQLQDLSFGLTTPWLPDKHPLMNGVN